MKKISLPPSLGEIQTSEMELFHGQMLNLLNFLNGITGFGESPDLIEKLKSELKEEESLIQTSILKNLDLYPDNAFNKEHYPNFSIFQQSLVESYANLYNGNEHFPAMENDLFKERLLTHKKQSDNYIDDFFAGTVPGVVIPKISMAVTTNDQGFPISIERRDERGELVSCVELIEKDGLMSCQLTLGRKISGNEVNYGGSTVSWSDDAIYRFTQIAEQQLVEMNQLDYEPKTFVNKKESNLNKILESVTLKSRSSEMETIKSIFSDYSDDKRITNQEIEAINEQLKSAHIDTFIYRKDGVKGKELNSLGIADDNMAQSVAEFLDGGTPDGTNTYTAPVPKPNGTPTIER